MLACQFFFLAIWNVERIVALAQRLKDDAVFIHLVQTGEQLASNVLKLVALGGAEGRPELVQAVVLRWQHFAQEFVTFLGQLQMQAAAIVIAFTAFNPAALFQFIRDTGPLVRDDPSAQLSSDG